MVVDKRRTPIRTEEFAEKDILRGTTLRVYRYMFKQARPVGFHDIQRALGLSSVSVSQYHVQKLLDFGFIRGEDNGYVVEKVVFDNMIRVKGNIIPINLTYVVFFAMSLGILLLLFSPTGLTPLYLFAVVVNVVALGITAYGAVKAVLRPI